MKEKLNQIDAILNELQMDEYLNEDSLPKIGKAREIVQQLVINCNAPDVSVNEVKVRQSKRKAKHSPYDLSTHGGFRRT